MPATLHVQNFEIFNNKTNIHVMKYLQHFWIYLLRHVWIVTDGKSASTIAMTALKHSSHNENVYVTANLLCTPEVSN